MTDEAIVPARAAADEAGPAGGRRPSGAAVHPRRPVRVPERFRASILRVQPYADDVFDEVDAFQVERFPEGSRQADPLSRRWLFDQTPFADEDGPAFWICRRDGKVVGQQTEMPVDFQVGGKTERLGWAIDLMVDPEWRLRGVGPALVATVLGHRGLIGVLYASRDGYPAFLKAGCFDLGPMPVYRRPLDARRALALPRVPGAVRRLAPVVAPALLALDGVAALALRASGARLVPVDAFDERVDEVWERAGVEHQVLARRDLDAVRWKIDGRPDRDLLLRYYLVRKRKTLGYVVLRPTTSNDEPTVAVVDYLAPSRWVAPMLVAAGHAARRQGAISISVRTRNPAADRALRLAGFVRAFQEGGWPIHHMIHCSDDDPEVRALVEDPEAWFLTAADGDLESPDLTFVRRGST